MRNGAKFVACMVLMLGLMVPAFGVVSEPQADGDGGADETRSVPDHGYGGDDFSEPGNTTVLGSANVSGGNLTLNGVYYQTDFNDGSMDEWIIVKNYIEVKNGYMRTNTGYVKRTVSFDNFTLEFDVLISKLDVKGFNEGYKFYVWGENLNHIFACYYENQNDTIFFHGSNDFVYFKTKEMPYYPITNEWYHVRIEHQNQIFNVSIDDKQLVSMEISSFTGVRAIGIGAMEWGDIYYDNIVIRTDDGHGHAITPSVTIPYNRLWDRVEINKTENPLGTVRFTVLRPYASPVFHKHENLSVSTEDITDILVDDTDKLYLEFWLDGLDRNWPTVDWWRIYWRPDPPIQYYDTPQVRLREDEPVENALNLADYFGDWYTGGFSLFFQASYSSNPNHVLGIVNGYNLSIELPTKDWYGTETIRVNCSDGEFTTESRDIIVVVTPVNDPPVISPMGTFEATEESVSVLNLTQFVSDPETPIEGLRIGTSSDNCTVLGGELHFLYSVGSVTEEVDISVGDGEFTVHEKLNVTVVNVNDRPVISAVLVQSITEEAPFTIDLSPFLQDEDDPVEYLAITSDSPYVSGIAGRNLTVLVEDYIEPISIPFNVSDGDATVAGVIPIIVEPVNDPPVMLSIGGKPLPGPLSFDLLEGGQAWLTVEASDADSEVFNFYSSSNLGGVEILANGTLRILLSHGDVGTFWAVVTVDDLDGGTAEANITLEVANVNDPPEVPRILSPSNSTVFDEGASVSFCGEYSDPDMLVGQVLTMVWRSNLSGVLAQFNSENAYSFIRSNLTQGRHLITVTVSDGEYNRLASVVIEIREIDEVPPNNGNEEEQINPIHILLIIIIIIVISLIIIRLYKNR